jgi:hypothetical protein
MEAAEMRRGESVVRENSIFAGKVNQKGSRKDEGGQGDGGMGG